MTRRSSAAPEEINRRILPAELDEAVAQARAAGLWRFDSRWRRMRAAGWA